MNRRLFVRGIRLVGLTVMVAIAAAGAVSQSASSATGPIVYSATVTVPAPPASNFAGANGGGDGWSVGLTPTQVFNVFHHSSITQVNCHNQSDASACWSNPKTVTDGSGNNFSTSIAPGLFVAPDTGHLFVPVVRTSDNTSGILCIDTTQPAAASGASLYCGFTALTPAGEGSGGSFSANGLSAPVQVGSSWYIMNEVAGAPTGAQDRLLCFDLNTKAACAGQPYPVDRGGTNYSGGSYSYPIGAAGTRIFIPIVGSPIKLACFDTTNPSVGTCGGAWPVTVSGAQGAPYPLLDGSGGVLGICDPLSTIVCFDLNGAAVATPAGMSSAISSTIQYGSAAVVIGPRVYVPESGANAVGCYDYNLGSSCVGFPKAFSNLSLLYSVSVDPQRPTCLWVNADSGSAQIQNFDAFTGSACGTGAIRLLASSILVPTDQCIPASYTSLQILSPPRSGYSDGTVAFLDGSGNPIAGATTHTFDGTGTADLTDLSLSTQNAFPQFLMTLNNPTSAIGSVTVKLTWTGADDPSCVKGSTTTNGVGTTVGQEESPKADVSVTKAATPAVELPLGGGTAPITYTLVVSNAGPDAAANVKVADAAPVSVTFVSATTSAGTCTTTAPALDCTISSIPAGGSVSITVNATVNATGTKVNTVTVTTTTPETSTGNNSASASTVVTAPATPPLTPKPKPKPVICNTVVATPKTLKANGKSQKFVVTVKKGSKAVAGAKVEVTGPGISKTVRTGKNGKVIVTIKPNKPGVVRVDIVGAKACNTQRLGVVGTFEPPVTG